ncbi:hypothetical protein L3V59_36255 [Burkholderia aenigmatica]|uniref:hypothetical protein n=1 Tax=Burkholderia aenigmatica TaxID=2015348 RepID=UPI001F463616|nr:hypothetical protein [Burkholderia aenigmatica]UKD17399.1 hypothetical protein L3V59_36255 [Burkholderia aenigmatica]
MSAVHDELLLSKAELAERTAVLWKHELEWVRQHPKPDLGGFHDLMEKELSSKDNFRLPPIDVAMWPEDVFCAIDVSDPEKFNDQFIELPMEVRASGFEKFFWGAHNGFALFCFSFMIFSEEKVDALFLYIISLVVFGSLICLFTFVLGRRAGAVVRFNRQAQLVHVDKGDGNVAHIPWRHVQPMTCLGTRPSAILRVCAPEPHARSETNRLTMINRKDAEKINTLFAAPYGIPVTMTDTDHSSVPSNLRRLEFLRRYMEHGLLAIQPHPAAIEQGLVERAEDFDNPRNICATGWAGKYVFYPIDRAWHYFCLGPWLDKRARRAAEAFDWSEEVKNLCGRNPDLRGLDPRPVKSRTDIYYRPDAFSFQMVDRYGRPVSDQKARW